MYSGKFIEAGGCYILTLFEYIIVHSPVMSFLLLIFVLPTPLGIK